MADRERFRAPVRLGHHYCTCTVDGYCYLHDELIAAAVAVGNAAVGVGVADFVAVVGDSSAAVDCRAMLGYPLGVA